MPRVQPIVRPDQHNNATVRCALCENPFRLFDTVYGTLTTPYMQYGSVQCSNGTRKSCGWPITVTGRFCTACSLIFQSEPHVAPFAIKDEFPHRVPNTYVRSGGRI
jgi:hypothetical protein